MNWILFQNLIHRNLVYFLIKFWIQFSFLWLTLLTCFRLKEALAMLTGFAQASFQTSHQKTTWCWRENQHPLSLIFTLNIGKLCYSLPQPWVNTLVRICLVCFIVLTISRQTFNIIRSWAPWNLRDLFAIVLQDCYHLLSTKLGIFCAMQVLFQRNPSGGERAFMLQSLERFTIFYQ